MDADHRHELRDNDLMEFILDFKVFLDKWGNTIMWTALIAASVFATVRLYNYRKQQQHEAAWSDLAQSSAPAVLVKIASEYSDPAVKALAYLSAGDIRLAEAAHPPAEGEEPVDANAPEKAAATYRQALEAGKGETGTLYRLNAMLGLATAYEQQQQWDKARTQYQQVVKEADDRYTRIAALAKANLALLDQLQTPIVFGPEPPKAKQNQASTGDKPIGDLLGTNPTTGLPNLDLNLSPDSPETPVLNLPQGTGSFDLSTDKPAPAASQPKAPLKEKGKP